MLDYIVMQMRKTNREKGYYAVRNQVLIIKLSLVGINRWQIICALGRGRIW